MTDLDLGLIGNCSFAALVDGSGRIVWCCLPRFDGDPVFSALLSERNDDSPGGVFAIELAGMKASEQAYCTDTIIGFTFWVSRANLWSWLRKFV